MTTSDYALIMSLASIVISIVALLWNIWQKFLFVKPTLQVSFGIGDIMQSATATSLARSGRRLLVLSVTNMGPGPVVLYACIAQSKGCWWTRPELGTLNPIHGDAADPYPESIGPFSAGLPTKIDAGEINTFYFPYEKDCFLKDGLVRIGINDTYHRNNWCHRRDVRNACKAYSRDFPLQSHPTACDT
jgi:hypothetical protein